MNFFKNFFKKLFTKRVYKTVYSVSCRVNLESNWEETKKVDANIILKVDELHDKHRCYITDGEHETEYDVSLLAINCPNSIPVLEKYNIVY